MSPVNRTGIQGVCIGATVTASLFGHLRYADPTTISGTALAVALAALAVVLALRFLP